jgi:soluble lytic murein transglycosylase-like protein
MLLRTVLCAGTLLAVAATSQSRELVTLKNGFTLEAESHSEAAGELTFHAGGGTILLPSSEIDRIEILEDRPAANQNAEPSSRLGKTQAVDVDALLGRAAASEGVEDAFVRSVAKAESGYSPAAVSKKGAIGLMQLMPATAATLGVDPKDAEANAQGGARYLRELLVRYHGNSALALAAYNAGPGAVARYGGVPPFGETRAYIVRVTREYDRRQKLATARARAAKKATAAEQTASAAGGAAQ